jgi:hypothetical protein
MSMFTGVVGEIHDLDQPIQAKLAAPLHPGLLCSKSTYSSGFD